MQNRLNKIANQMHRMHANAFATKVAAQKEEKKKEKNCLRIYKFNIVYAILYI